MLCAVTLKVVAPKKFINKIKTRHDRKVNLKHDFEITLRAPRRQNHSSKLDPIKLFGAVIQ